MFMPLVGVTLLTQIVVPAFGALVSVMTYNGVHVAAVAGGAIMSTHWV